MDAKKILQSLKNKLEIDSTFDSKEIESSNIYGTEKTAELTVIIPIEGCLRLIKIKAEDLGLYCGVEI